MSELQGDSLAARLSGTEIDENIHRANNELACIVVAQVKLVCGLVSLVIWVSMPTIRSGACGADEVMLQTHACSCQCIKRRLVSNCTRKSKVSWNFLSLSHVYWLAACDSSFVIQSVPPITHLFHLSKLTKKQLTFPLANDTFLQNTLMQVALKTTPFPPDVRHVDK